MTRARALKTVIRARAAKTGERYTTARRHVLNALQARTSPVRAAVIPIKAPPPAPVKGSISNAKSIEKTGYDLAHWFDVLDRFDAVKKGHTAAARHLNETHGVDGWYSQGITVSYERARGMRAVNQRTSGKYEVSVSKVVPADIKAAIAAFEQKRRRSAWATKADPALAKALAAGLDAAGSKGFVVKPKGHAICRYKWDGTVVEVYVEPKGSGKSSVVVRHAKLLSKEALDERRAQWRAALASLAGYLSR
jgi:hypothetical protein